MTLVSSKPSLYQILSASLEELTLLRIAHPDILCPDVAYMHGLGAYLEGDLESLSRIQEQFLKLTTQDSLWIKNLLDLRYRIRRGQVDAPSVSRWLAELPAMPKLWWAETRLVAALAFEKCEENLESKNCYQRAAEVFEELGFATRALRARLNSIAIESRITPEKTFMVQYRAISHRAEREGLPSIAGVATLNLSREYHKVSAYGPALAACDKAILLLRAEYGSLHYALACAHRAHVLIDLKRTQEAEEEMRSLSTFHFPEVTEALAVLAYAMDPGAVPYSMQQLTPTWRERLEQLRAHAHTVFPKLALLEAKLFDFLSTQPRDKYEIGEHLYGNRISLHAIEVRVKRLLNRLRKKRPNTIVFHEGRYSTTAKMRS